MNAQWQELMQASAPQFEDVARSAMRRSARDVSSDDSAAAGTALTLYDNGPLAVIDAVGRDAGTFLQSQLCNDLLKLPIERAQITGYCTPKGRLLTVFTVFAVDDDGRADENRTGADDRAPACYRLLMPASIVEGALKRLRMFVMRADVTFTVREDLVCIGLSCTSDVDPVDELAGWPSAVRPSAGRSVTATGAEVEADLPGAGHPATLQPLSSPAEPMAVTTLASGVNLLRWPDSVDTTQQRHLLIGPSHLMAELWQAKAPTATLANHAAWRLADIGAGLPHIEPATLEAFVPQMVNLQLIDALSFKKGCYPGQEIVARMHYLGKLKRHMRRFRLTGLALEAVGPGSAVLAGSDVNAGIVVDAIAERDTVELLAVVKVGVTDLHIDSVALEALELPYVLPTQGDDVDAGLPPVQGVSGASR